MSKFIRSTGRDLACLAFGLLVGIGVTGYSADLPNLGSDLSTTSTESVVRLEALGGKCGHRLASDSSWSYREWGSYETNMNLHPACYQVGLSVMPWTSGAWKFGFRAAYVDLGRIDADNTFPVDEPEYFRAKNSGTPVNSATERFQGTGGSRGVTLGFATERKVGPLYVGPEAGVALLYARWHVEFPNGAALFSGCRDDWACADGLKATAYAGATLRYGWLMLSARRYLNVRASQAQSNPLFIGPTTGPVDSVMVGISVTL